MHLFWIWFNQTFVVLNIDHGIPLLSYVSSWVDFTLWKWDHKVSNQYISNFVQQQKGPTKVI